MILPVPDGVVDRYAKSCEEFCIFDHVLLTRYARRRIASTPVHTFR